jgi:hypothetical protein
MQLQQKFFDLCKRCSWIELCWVWTDHGLDVTFIFLIFVWENTPPSADFGAGWPFLSWYNIPGKIYQLTTKNILHGHKIYQMATKYTNISIARPFKIYPNWNVWFLNIPSGNPASEKLIFGFCKNLSSRRTDVISFWNKFDFKFVFWQQENWPPSDLGANSTKFKYKMGEVKSNEWRKYFIFWRV